jgi:hypothetical protein
MFHLPLQWARNFKPFTTDDAVTLTFFSKAALSEIRNLEFVFSVDQVAKDDFVLVWKNYEKAHGPGSFSNLTVERRRDMVT